MPHKTAIMFKSLGWLVLLTSFVSLVVGGYEHTLDVMDILSIPSSILIAVMCLFTDWEEYFRSPF